MFASSGTQQVSHGRRGHCVPLVSCLAQPPRCLRVAFSHAAALNKHAPQGGLRLRVPLVSIACSTNDLPDNRISLITRATSTLALVKFCFVGNCLRRCGNASSLHARFALASAAIPCTKACTEEGRSMPRRPRTTTPPLADSNELDVFLNGSKNPVKDFCWWDLDGVCLLSLSS